MSNTLLGREITAVKSCEPCAVQQCGVLISLDFVNTMGDHGADWTAGAWLRRLLAEARVNIESVAVDKGEQGGPESPSV